MVKEVKSTLDSWSGKGMIPTKEFRSFLGKLEWVAGIIPRLRWTVSSMYAVLTNVLHQEDKEVERAKQRTGDKRPKLGLVATKRLAQQCPG